jgi:Ca2+-binding EF-hand superfamily protein
VKALVAHFDKDGSGTLDFDEFLVAIRGHINEFRLEFVKRAY